jgi:phosphoglycerate dehydrogenase-like enzyme
MLLVGLGHTGVEVARRARALGMRVVAVRASGLAHPDADEVHGPEALGALLPEADVLSLHVRLSETTAGMIGAGELALLPPGALVLNAARGAVLSEEGLLGALERNVAGAWLDVFEEEPLPELNPLWRHPRILVSPHCADQVVDFPARFAARFRDLWLATR